jgi:site-specific DNA recombinase
VKRYSIYARTAVAQELGSNFALAEQIHECKEYATRKGYEAADPLVYQESGSGMNPNRPALEEVLKAAREGKFNVLIIRDFARLARKQAFLLDIIHLLSEIGVEVESVTGQREVMAIAGAAWETVERIHKELLVKRMQAGKRAKRGQA